MSISSINKKIIYLLHVLKISGSIFEKTYRDKDRDLVKTSDYLLKGRNFSNNHKLNDIIKFIEDYEIDILNISDEKYPEPLKNIDNIAPILFCKGDKIFNSKLKIAIVGTRNASDYGRKAAEYFGSELSKLNITVVSGMAKGIDSWAQKSALSNKGGSIGVLGCGINYIYPISNKALYCDILENGSLISEYLPNSHPNKKNFPWRNRIISGLCRGVVVIESGERGGAMITAKFAVKQGRKVFAVPGDILQSRSRGTNFLIRKGAKLIRGIDDLLSEIKGFRDLFF